MLDAYLYEGRRTPFGRYGGALSKVRPDDLLGQVIQKLAAATPASRRASIGVVPAWSASPTNSTSKEHMPTID